MADIRKRTGAKGTTYQVRYPAADTKSGYTYKTFPTLKAARAFLEGGEIHQGQDKRYPGIETVIDAVNLWLDICEKEGLNGRDPVTRFTLKNYVYRAGFIKSYPWSKSLYELTSPDVVEFRSWLLRTCKSRELARKVLASFQSVIKEMTLRGVIPSNVATGISIRADSRYDEPIVIPTREDVIALLSAADRLANSKNLQIARTWQRYRPMLYLAADSGMRPQEYIALSHRAISKNGVKVERAVEGGGDKLSVTKTPAGRRFIELSANTLDMVKHYAENHAIQNGHDLVFPANNGRWQCPRNWRRRGFNAACFEAGLVDEIEKEGGIVERPKYRPYDLRHFFASMLFEKKVNLKKIQVLMGHTNISTTLNTYGHLIEDLDRVEDEDYGMLSQLGAFSCGESVASAP
ncbi:MAG: site-specific integrase [Candidatus Thiodiazotropha sp.]